MSPLTTSRSTQNLILIQYISCNNTITGLHYSSTHSCILPLCRIHVVFGHVLQGQEVVSQIENQSVDDKSRPLSDVKIGNCGELIPKTKAKGIRH